MHSRSIDLLLRDDRKENAAQVHVYDGFADVVTGRCADAKQRVDRGLAIYRSRAVDGNSAIALSMCGDARGVQMADDLGKRYPKDTFINLFVVPMTRAAAESNRGNTAAAIEALKPAMQYELGNMPGYWLNYLHGTILLKGKMGHEAAAEFRKIIDHRGIEPVSIVYPLAHHGLARAAAMTGDAATARKAYQDFLAIWKDADPDLPLLIEAKQEYDQLK